MRRARKKRHTKLLWPPKELLEPAQKKLTVAEPLDLRVLVKNSRKKRKDGTSDVFDEFRRCYQEQVTNLLRQLGIDPTDPNAWQKGFYKLATYDRGAGHLCWSPRRTNRNAGRWTNEHDLNLLGEVVRLRAEGLSEREAVRRLSRDPTKRGLFPYRPRRAGFEPKGTATQRYEAALWARLQHLKDSATGDSLLALFGYVARDDIDPFERILHDLDHAHSQSQLVKIKDALLPPRS
jgi:hypothetical protein